MQPAGRVHRRRRWWAAVVPAAVVFAACVPPKQPPPPPASPLFQAACDGVLQGSVAERFAQRMRDVVAEENVSAERFEEFLEDFDVQMNQPVLYH